MTDPLAFAEARLGEDQAPAAEAARDGFADWQLKWRNPGMYTGTTDIIDDEGVIVARVGTPVAAHVARQDPARALRDVEAGHRILGRHRDCVPYGSGPCERAGLAGNGPCPDMRDLLARWSGHPDYRQDWKP